MTADLKPCPFCGMAPSRSYGGRSGNRIWCANERCQERPLIAAETWSGAASIWNPIAPTVSDTGADSGPGASTPQPGEAPVSSAPAPTMADLIDNLMQIEMLTATGDGLDPATTIDVHLLAGIGRAVEDDAAWHFRATAMERGFEIEITGEEIASTPLGISPNKPLPTLAWPDDNPPPSWWGKGPNGELTRVYRSYEDYCDD